MIKKRSRPHPRQRQISIDDNTDDGVDRLSDNEGRNLTVEDLIEYRKFRKSRQGIDASKLNQGETKKKRARQDIEEDGEPIASPTKNISTESDGDKAKSVIRSNNFTQQTNALDVDKHMMTYIEENLKLRRGVQDFNNPSQENFHEDLYNLPSKYKMEKQTDEGNVTNSLAMLTAIPEVDLGMDNRLKNIEETEKAKRAVAEERKERGFNKYNDEEHLVATRFFKPNLRQKTDADIIRDAKLEAMGLPPEESDHRPYHDRVQVATDELVMERFKKRLRK